MTDQNIARDDAISHDYTVPSKQTEEITALYRALRYLEQEAQLAGLRLVATIIGAAALGTQDVIEGRRLDA